MRKLVCAGPPDPARFALEQAAIPAPGRGEVLVELEATAVNPIDVKRAAGHGRRLLSLKNAARFPRVLGNDLVGTVLALGADARRWQVGDRVFGLLPTGPQGAHASHVVVGESLLRTAPRGRPADSLATLPYTFTTLWLALEGAGLGPEDARDATVLVGGASGGLGRLALQLLSRWGARVTAVCSTLNVEACRKLGATEVVDRTRADVASLAATYDATLNFGAWTDEASILERLSRGACGHATTVHPLLASFDELGWVGGMLRVRREKSRMRAITRSKGAATRYAWTVFRPSQDALDALEHLVTDDAIRLPVGLRVDLADGARAFEHVAAGRPGRAVIACA